MIFFFLFFVLSLKAQYYDSEECPNNLVFQECGSACIHRCSDGPIPPVCPFICIENVCRCEYPLIFHNNRCIPYSQCPKKCDRNSTFTNCDTACPLKCSDYPFKPKPCTKQCILNSCACKPGFVLNAFKKCIRKEDCPQWRRPPKKPKCKNRRKVFSTCPNHEENYCFPLVYRARNCGTPRCICKRGFVKYRNKCVRLSVCRRLISKKN